MAAFEYIALDAKGKQQKGVLEGDSSKHIRQQLRAKGWMPLEVGAAASGSKSAEQTKGFAGLFQRGAKLSVPELALFTRQLATLIAAGLPIDEALAAVAEQSEKQSTEKMILAIKSKVLEGHTLANALAEYPRAFPKLYRATVSAGEHAGHLDGVLNRLADYTEAQHESQSKIKLAAIYPIILSVVAVGIVVALLTYVVPDIVEVFVKNGQELPGLTAAMLSLSHFITDFGLYVLISIAVGLAVFTNALRNEKFRFKFHLVLLKTPVIDRFVRDANTARFVSTLAILTSSGVPLVEGMKIATQVVENLPIKDALSRVTVEVSEGGSLSAAMKTTGHFTPMMIHMVASGESSGELDQMLERTSAQQEKSLQDTVTAMVSMMEPVMLLSMGAIVATIVAAIMMPILQLNELVR